MDEQQKGEPAGFLSSPEAAKLYGITNDYVARLCRQRKLNGFLKNRTWFIEKSSLTQFFGLKASGFPAESANSALMTSREAADLYLVTNDYIARLCRVGKIKGEFRDTTWMVDKRSLDKFFAARGRKPVRGTSAPTILPTPIVYLGDTTSAGSAAAPASARPLKNIFGKIRTAAIVAFVIIGLYTYVESAAAQQMVGLRVPGSLAAAVDFPLLDNWWRDISRSVPAAAVAQQNSVPSSTTTYAQTVVNNSYNTYNQTYHETYNDTYNSTTDSEGVSESELTTKLGALADSLNFQSIPTGLPSSGGNANNIALSQNIGNLDGTHLSNITVSGVSGLQPADIPALPYLAVSGGALTGSILDSSAATSSFAGALSAGSLVVTSTTSTSTLADGINLSGGCFSVNGTCLTSGGGGAANPGGSDSEVQFNDGGAFDGSSSFTFSTTTQLVTFSSASTTIFSSSDEIFVGSTATTTIQGSATSTFGAGIAATALDLTGGATSTSANGFNITAGCFSVNGTCITSGGGSSSVSTSSQNTWGALQLFAGNASSSNFSNFGVAYFGGSATSSFNSAGQLTLAGLSDSLLSTDQNGQVVATTTIGSDLLNVPADSLLAGNASGQLIATTSIGANLLTGILGIGNGGTGIATAPGFGQLLVGNGSGGFSLLATSSLGIADGASASSTLLTDNNTFLGGNLFLASTTIGNGSAGLTINGSATTTGSAYFAGNVGIGTTSPYAKLSVAGTNGGAAPLFVISSSTSAFATTTVFSVDQNGNTTIGNNGSVFSINGATTTASDGFNISAGCFAVNGVCVGSGSGSSDVSTSSQNVWSALQLFEGNASTSEFTATSSVYFTSLTNDLLSTNANGQLVATTSIGTNLLTGNLTTINNTTIGVGTANTITAASSTLLSNNNTWTGLQNFSNASTSLATLTTGWASIFNVASLTATNATTSSLYVTGVTSHLLKTDSNGQVVPAIAGTDYVAAGTYLTGLGAYATTTAAAISLSTSTQSFNGLTFGTSIGVTSGALNFAPTVSGTLNNSGLTNSAVSFTSSAGSLNVPGSVSLGSSGNFDINTAHSNFFTALQNFTNATTSSFEATSTDIYLDSFKNSLLGVNASGQLISTTSIGTNLLTGTLGTANGGTGINSTPSYGNILVGNGTNYTLTATSSLGLASAFTSSYPILYSGNNLSLAFGTTTANTFSQLQTFAGGASTTNISASGTGYFTAASTSQFTATSSVYFTSITNGLLSTNANGQVVATSTIASNLLSVPANSLLAGNSSGQLVATSSIGTSLLTGNLATINGTTIGVGTTNTITAASSTLLANSNTFSGTNAFTGATTFGNATTTNLFSTTASSTNLFSQLAAIGTLSLNGLTNSLLSVNGAGQVVATSTIGNGELQNSSITVNGTNISLGGSATITAASSTLLANSNTWTGLQNFSNATSSLLTATTAWIGTLNLTTALTPANGGTGIASTPSYGQLLVGNGTNYTLTATSSLGLAPAFTASYPILSSGNNLSLAFGTTTANTFSNLQTFASGFVSQASSTVAGNFTTTGTATLGNVVNNGLSANQFVYTNGAKEEISVASSSLDLPNAALQNSAISGVSLGSNLNNVTFSNSGSGASSGQTYNGSAATTISYNTIGAQAAGTYLTGLGNYATTTGTAVSLSTSTLAFNGLTLGETIQPSANSILFTPTLSGALANAGLANSTIKLNGVTLTLGDTGDTVTAASSTLLANNNTFSGNDTFNSTITGSISGNANTATTLQTSRTINGVGFNGSANITINAASSTALTDANTWTKLQSFSNATSTLLSATTAWIGTLNLTTALTPANGGTGIATTPSYGQLLLGNGTNYTLTATSSLGLQSQITGSTGQVDYFSGTNTPVGTSSLDIASTGFVGIGAASPTYLLDISATSTATTTALSLANISANSNAAVAQTFNLALSGSSAERSAAEIVAAKSGSWTSGSASTVNSDLAFFTRSDDVLNEQMRLTAGGFLGIGTTTPGSIFSINGVGNFVASATSTLYNSLALGGNLNLNNLTNSLLSTNGSGQLIATTSIGTNLLTGTLGTINGTTLNEGGSITVASTTLLANNNTFSGNDTFNNTITGSISGNAGTATTLQTSRTINSVSFNGSSNIVINAASSTALTDANTWTGLQNFSNATSSLLTATTAWIGTLNLTTALTPANGGTGIASTPSYGQLLVGNGTNYTLTATSSLGLAPAFTASYPILSSGNNLSLAFGTTTANTFSNLQTFASGFVSQASSTVAGNFTTTGTATLGNVVNNGLSANQFVYTNGAKEEISVASSSLDLPNAALQNSAISGVSLGSNLNNVTFSNSGSGASSGQTYNGSAATTISYNTIGAQAAGTYLTGLGNYATTTGTAVSLSTSTLAFNGLTLGETIQPSANSILFTPTLSGALANAGLANSTIKLNGVTLTLGDTGDTVTAASSTLLANNNTFSGNDTFNSTITGSISGNANTATTLQTSRTINGVGFNGSANITINAASSTALTDANTWTKLQSFSNATSTLLSATTAWIGTLNLTTALTPANGGTGIATTPSYGQLLLGNGTNYTLTATSSLGLQSQITGSTGQVDYFSGTNTPVGTSSLDIASTGFVGIGAASPTYLLDISATSTATTTALSLANISANSNAAVAQTFNLALSGSSAERSAAEIVAAKSGSWTSGSASTVNSDLAFFTRSDDVLNEQMRLTAGGFLGIGTTTPGSIFSINGVGNFVASATSTLYNSLALGGNLNLNNLTNSLLSTNGSGQLIATTSIGTNLLTGTLGTINGTTLNEGGSITVASTTLLANNNTFSGNDTFNNTITGSISGNAGTATTLQTSRTINSVSFNGSSNIVINAASSTALTDANTWTGLQNFSNATSSLLTATTAWIGTLNLTTALTPANGGTGIASTPSYGQLLVGNGTNYTLTATSSLGLAPAFTASYPILSSGNNLSLAFGTTTANTFSNLQTFASGFVSQASSTVAGNFTTTGTATLGNVVNNGLSANQFVYTNGAKEEISVASSSLDLPNAALQNSAISGVSLGSNLNNVTFSNSGSGASSGQTYNGSAATTISYNTIGAQAAGTYLTGLGNYATTTGTAVSLSTSTLSWNGLTLGNTFAISSSGILVTPTVSGTLNNSGLANSTIKLNGATLTLGDTNDTITAASSTALTDANTWTKLQSFSNATSSLLSATTAWIGTLNLTTALSIANGGTGINSTPSYGNILVGNGTNYTLTATSSLGLQSPLVGSTGQVAYFSGTNSPVGTPSLDIASTGFVGIGTTTPIDELQVAGLANPIEVGSTTNDIIAPLSVAVSGRYAYVANYTHSFAILDVSNPADPVDVGFTTSGLDNPIGVSVSGRYAYVVDEGNSSLIVFDVSNPADPVEVGSTTSGLNSPNSIYLSGHYAYVTSRSNNTLAVFDISNPASPVEVGSTTSGLDTPDFVTVSGRYAYVVNYNGNSIVVFDISNPINPVEVGSTTSGLINPNSIAVSGRYAYVTSSNGSALVIFDISNPASPVEVGSTTSGLNTPLSVAVSGRYAYVTNYGNNALVVFDISNPINPVEVGSTTSGLDVAEYIAVSGRYAYVASLNNSTFVVFQIGGEYTQSLEAGTLQAGSLELDNNLQATDGAFAGGLTVGNNANVGGSLNITASTYNATTTAGQAYSLFSVNTASSTNPLFNVFYNGNVGIGTTTPGSALSINGVGNFVSSATSTLYDGLNLTSGCFSINGTCVGGSSASSTLLSDNNTFSGIDSFSKLLRLTATTSSLLATDASGNVIATTSIGTNLLTGTLGIGNGGTGINSTPSYGNILVGNGTNYTLTATSSLGLQSQITGSTGQVAYFSGTNTPVGTSSLDIASTGFVGIGAASPTYLLDISATSTATTTALSLANISANSNAAVAQTFNLALSGSSAERSAAEIVAAKSGSWTSGSASTVNSDLAFFTRSDDVLNEQMRLTAGGFLGIGTTTPGSIFSINGVGNFVASATSTLYNSLALGGNLNLNNLTNSLLSTNGSGQLIATTSIGTNLLTGTLGTINGTTLNEGGSITVASTTLLANNNTFSGNDTFNNTITGSISGNAGTATTLQTSRTINSVSFNGSSNIVINAASSTALTDANTWTGLQNFSNATSSLLTATTAWIGTLNLTTALTPANGGTGIASTPSYGQLLVGNGSGYTLTATSSLGIQASLSGTQGQVAYFSGTNTPVGTSSLDIASTGFVGIGTTTPIDELQVAGLANPIEVGSTTTDLAAATFVAVSGNYAYVTSEGYSSLDVYDVSNPASPVWTGVSGSGLLYPLSVTISGRYAYVANEGNNALVVFDISNPADPVEVGSTTSGLNEPYSVAISGHYAYVASFNNNALVVFDISNPADPVEVGSTTSGLSYPRSVTISGHYAYVLNFDGNSLAAFDISDPVNPVEVGSIVGSLGNPISVTVSGSYAYITSYANNYLVIDDISNPALPVQVGSTSSGLNEPFSVDVSGRYAYVTNYGNNALVVFDVSNPADPVEVGSTTSGLNEPESVSVSGRYAYVANYGNSSLVIFQIGGEYTQSLEAGTLQAGSLELDNNLQAVDGAFAGGLTVGNNANVGGSLNVTASTFNATTTASQAYSLFSVNTASSTNPLFNVFYNGNVGIGTTTPFATLSVNGSGYFGGDLNVSGSGAGYEQNGGSILYASTTNNAVVVGPGSGTVLLSSGSGYDYNTVVGSGSLNSGSFSGSDDNVIGAQAGSDLTSGSDNEIFGTSALRAETTGWYNVAIGDSAGYNNASGGSNVFIGNSAGLGQSGASQSGDVGIGYDSLYSIGGSASAYNTAIGYQSGNGIVGGTGNVLLGPSVDSTSKNQVYTGDNNISIGYDVALPSTTANDQLDIGNEIYGTGLNGTDNTVSSGLIGIGSTTPFAQLSIAQSATSPAFSIWGAASSTPSFIVSSLDNSGNIGYGTTTPWGDVSITNDTIDPGLVVSNPTNSLTQFIVAGNGNVGVGTTTPWAALSVQAPADSASPQFVVASSTAISLVMTDTGLLGVGSTTPDQELTVNGNVNIASGKCYMVNDVCIGYVVKLAYIYATSTPSTSTTDDKVTLAGTANTAPAWTASTATLALPANTSYFVVELWGGGGGGGGSGTAAGGTPGTGGGSTFGSATATSTSGGGNPGASTPAAGARTGGTGGTASAISSPNSNLGINGQAGGNTSSGTSQFTSGEGGNSPRGGQGGTSLVDTTTTVGNAGTIPGGGGGGAAYTTAGDSGSGGGGGAYTETLFASPSGTYTASIGAGGAGGTAGTSGGVGGAGASGEMVISVYATSSPNATGNDYAEMFPVSNPNVTAGDIVAVDTGTPVSLTYAQENDNLPLAGVVSTAPGQVIGDTSDVGYRPIALSGRVPVNVNLQNGPINIGDRIAVSSDAGVGMKAGPFDDSVGIALSSYDGTGGTVQPDGSVEGTVTVLMDLQQGIDINDIALGLLGNNGSLFVNPATGVATSSATSSLDFVGGVMNAIASRVGAYVFAPAATSSQATSTNQTDGYAGDLLQSIFAQITQWLASADNGIGDLFAGTVHAKQFCAEKSDGTEVCITGDQLAAILANADASNSAPASSGGSEPSDDSDSNATSSSAATSSPPVLDLNGDNPATVDVGATYQDLGATITGPIGDLNLGIQASVDGGATTTVDQIQLDTSQPGTHTIIYSATDQNGLTGYASREVDVVAPDASADSDASSTSSDDSDDSGDASSTNATSTSP